MFYIEFREWRFLQFQVRMLIGEKLVRGGNGEISEIYLEK